MHNLQLYRGSCSRDPFESYDSGSVLRDDEDAMCAEGLRFGGRADDTRRLVSGAREWSGPFGGGGKVLPACANWMARWITSDWL